jgi:WD40 repeat protein/tetratricopeptide (TPR) repeat protein
VKVWDAHTGQELLTLKGHTELLHSVCFSPDGRRLATASSDKTVKVWDAHTGQELVSLRGHADLVSSVCFSPDGLRLATASWDRTVKVWDAQTGQDRRTLKGHTAAVDGVCFSPDGRRLATASYDMTVRVWDAQDEPELLMLRGHTDSVTAVCFSPDGRRLATAARDKMVKTWDAQTGQELLALKGHAGRVVGVCFSPDGKRLASASEGKTVKVWDGQTGQELLTLQGHSNGVTGVCFSPDGRRLASASYYPDGGDARGELKVWDARTGQDLLTLRGLTSVARSVCFSPDGRRLATACGGALDAQKRLLPGEVKVWDAQTGHEQLTLKGQARGGGSVCFSPDGRRLATDSLDQTVKLWDVQTGQELLTFGGHTDTVESFCFSPDGRRLASASNSLLGRDPHGYVKVWDAQTGQELFTVKGSGHFFSAVCFSPDGRRLASVSSHLTVRVWDGRTGQEQLPLEAQTAPVASACFTPDGDRVVAADDRGKVRSWDAHTGREVVPCTDPAPHQPQAISPDGQWIVRIARGRVIVEPRVLTTGDLFNQRLADPVGEHLWHLRLTHEAQANQDNFALVYHLDPLLRTAFSQRAARPRDAFPFWAKRPPLAGTSGHTAADVVLLTAEELRGLRDRLSERLQATLWDWEGWAGRGWCRHLLGDLAGATADLKKAIELHPDEPGLWAVLGTVYLKHHRLEEAEAVHRRLADWAGIDVAVWDSAEADAGEQEEDWALASWHLDHWLAGLPAPCPQLLAQRGRWALEEGREADAARDYTAAVRAGRTDADTLAWCARACLAAGDHDGFQQSRAALLKQLNPRQQPQDATGVARVLLLAPAAAADVDPLLKVLPARPPVAVWRTSRGGLLLRAGHLPEAIADLQGAIAQRRPGEAPVADLLLALAQQQQGRTEAACRALERARFLLDTEAPVQQAADLLGSGTAGPWSATVAVAAALPSSPPRWDLATRLDIRILLREAEAALGERRP